MRKFRVGEYVRVIDDSPEVDDSNIGKVGKVVIVKRYDKDTDLLYLQCEQGEWTFAGEMNRHDVHQELRALYDHEVELAEDRILKELWK